MATTKELMKSLSLRRQCTRRTNDRSRSHIHQAKRRKEKGWQIMWPYTDEEADWLNG